MDKDSIVQGNDTYSREACMFLDRHTNRANARKGKKLVDGHWIAPND